MSLRGAALRAERKYRALHPDRIRENKRRYRRTPHGVVKTREWNWTSHGIDMTVDMYEKMFTAQGGVCAICRNPDQFRRLGVDHDHDTGLVRGLLCTSCNRAIGYLSDDPTRIAAAMRYLRGGQQWPLQ